MPKVDPSPFTQNSRQGFTLINKFESVNGRKGFTLIELMVSIAIVAIVASIGLTTYTQAQAIARDGRRKQDLASLKTALELYYQQNGNAYPTTSNSSIFSTNTTTVWQAVLGGSNYNNYINQLPTDPQNTGAIGSPASYKAYGYNSATGASYYLCTNLENPNSSDATYVNPATTSCLNDASATKWGNYQVKSQ